MSQNQTQLHHDKYDKNSKNMRLDAVIQDISSILAKKVSDIKKGKDLEKAIGVLAQDGLYAFYVFCLSKTWNKGNESLWKDVVEPSIKSLVRYIPPYQEKTLDENFFKELASSLHNLLFLRELIQKLLVYTRYHLKAMSAVEGENG